VLYLSGHKLLCMCIASRLILRVGLRFIMVMRWTEIGMFVYCLWMDIKGCAYVNDCEHCMYVLRCCVLRVYVLVNSVCVDVFPVGVSVLLQD
jgi:hypothetical protein